MTIARSPWEIAADLLFPPPDPYLGDPIAWGTEKLQEHYWSKQREILESVRDNRRTAVRSSHGIGKSFIAARAAAWWLDTHPVGSAFVATSAPTDKQVGAVLWREINKAHRKGDLIGRVNQKEWFIGTEMVGFGRKPADPAEGGDDETVTAFQGIHAEFVLVVLDEAGGIPAPLWAAAKSLMTGEGNHILVIGNPDNPSGEFERVCRPNSGWNVIGVSTFETPNFTDEVVPDALLRALPSQQWLDEFILDYGEESNIYTAKVLGQFPRDASDAVVPYSWAYACKELDFGIRPDTVVQMGVDVGAGVDESVITVLHDRKFLEQRRSRHDDPMKSVGEIISCIGEYRPIPTRGDNGVRVRVNIDAIGVGWGVAGRVAEVCEEKGWFDVEVNPIQVSELSGEPEKYKNLRSELWWAAREACHDKLWDLSRVDDQCISELTTPKWSENSSGQIEVEKREKIVARLGRSPDNASSLILAPYTGGAPEMVVTHYNDVRARGRR